MRAARSSRVRLAMGLCVCAAALPAGAVVSYSASSSARVVVYDGVDSFETTELVPLHSGPTGAQAASALSLAVLDSLGRPLHAEGAITAVAGPAGLAILSTTTQDVAGSPGSTYAFSEVSATASLSWSSLVTGAPGTVGSFVVEGWWTSSVVPGPAGPGTLSSLSAERLGLDIESRPLGGTCGTAACQEHFSSSATVWDGGSYRPSQGWLENYGTTVLPGEWLTVDAWVTATTRAGYATDRSLTAPPDSAQPGSFLVLRFSEGFAPADLSGLIDLGGGAYALAPAVPEPATWALWGVGLAALARVRRSSRPGS